MTYTVLGRCHRTGRLGIGIATFSITVGRYCYGVKSNAGETPIFWYKPAGGDVYRVIRADLTVVEADNAPEAKDAQRFAPVTDPTAERN